MTLRTLKLALALLVVSISGGCSDSGSEAAEENSEDSPAAFEVDGSRALLNGVIGSSTPDRVRDLLDDHPEVTTIVLVDVPGSEDDRANLEASRLVRAAGLATHLDADGFAASGGVDFFLSGQTRSFEPGAEFGVHSWATGDGIEGRDVPRDSEEHDLYLDYYEEMGIAEDFYWFTLEQAPADDFYIMTADDLLTYGFATA